MNPPSPSRTSPSHAFGRAFKFATQVLLAALAKTGLRLGSYRPTLSFSQEGEDLILKRLFDTKRNGFFIDVGAHHPARFSNTYALYLRGWRGLNIEPNPAAIPLFRILRSRDKTLNIAISNAADVCEYYMFAEPALNTIDGATAARLLSAGHRLNSVTTIDTLPLSKVLETHLAPDQEIDFFTIDAEGHDLQILRSNDWSRFRPNIIVAEIHEQSLTKAISSELANYLSTMGYQPFARTVNSMFFKPIRPLEKD